MPSVLAIIGVCAAAPRRHLGTNDFSTATAAAATAKPTGMNLVSRAYVPYGKGTGYAFGMGAAEQAAYDPIEKIAYVASEKGYVNLVSYANPSFPAVLDSMAIDLSSISGSLTDVDVCGGFLAVGVAASTKTDDGSVRVYSTAAAAGTAPALKASYTAGPLPDMVAFNADCSKIATANEGEGVYSSGLTDPEGSVSILSRTAPDWSTATVQTVSFGSVATSDASLIAAGVHLPLPKNAMIYFDDYSAKFKDDLDFTAARAVYTPATQLEPEYVKWSADGSKIYANCQENSAIITIDVASATATAIHALPLKDWSATGGTEGIDTVKDDACVLEYKPGFKTMRMPDAIAVASVDGTEYILTANEGDDKEYGDFESKQKFKDVIDSATAFDGDFAEFTFESASVGTEAAANFDGTKMSITIGSSAVDYTNTTNPTFKATVGFGGRGTSIWKASDMSLVWDSKSDFEKQQCANYPWAHNGVADEEFASIREVHEGALFASEKAGQVSATPPYQAITAGWTSLQETLWEINDPSEDGCQPGPHVTAGPGCDSTYCACPLGQTKDERSLKDGAGPEAIVVGEACGRLLMVTATEKQGTAFVYDVTDPSSPNLLFVQHLSPASEKKNPSVAYNDGTLGEVDPESITFLSAADSPTGNAGVLFAGAWSGTLSIYEFTQADGSKCSALPSPPPASSPPPPLTKSVEVTMTASGVVSDYDIATRSRLIVAFASAVSVDASAITLTVTAGSVNLLFTVMVSDATAAASVTSAVSTSLGTAAAASTVLGVTVETAPTAVAYDSSASPPSLPPPPAGASEGCGAGCIGGIVGGLGGLLFGVCGGVMWYMSKKKAIAPK